MTTEMEFAAQRFAVFAEQVLEPAVYPLAAPLDVAAYQCADPIPYAEAAGQSYQPVSVGWRWGPAWSTAWFRISGQVPPQLAGKPVALRFASGTEALLWDNGVASQGLEANHEAAVLFDPAAGGEAINLYVEAACNRPLGATIFWWEEQEARQLWQEEKPGRLARCELAAYDATAWRLWRTYDFARQLLALLPDDSERSRRLCDALRQVTASIDDTAVTESAPVAQALLEEALRGAGSSSQTRCFAIGHAHIDTAWLWRVRETERKCQRTFSTMLRLMEQYPDFRFLCSQAQQYAWLEANSPELFERVAKRVREGRWEPGGAMWVEPDCNVPSGESLVRQILHGTRYWQEKFGEQGKQRFLYVPDTFGYTASLPQILRLGGLDTFITNKLSWNDTNEFKHVNFRWRGIDGSEVIAHCTPGRDYNSTMTPRELLRGEKNAARLDRSRSGLWLQPFGYGDGGGGPTDWSVLYAELSGNCEGLPRVELSRVDSFCEHLARLREEQRAAGRDWPVWDGELYLELHRGTYTSQAWLKQANRRAEGGLFAAEWLTYTGPRQPSPEQAKVTMTRLDQAWKLLLLNQFHDILPGSSIAEVYADARQHMQEVRETYDGVIAEGIDRWSAEADTRGLNKPMMVFNPTSAAQSGVVECAEELHYVENVPPLGIAIIDRSSPSSVTPARVNGPTLSNGFISATIDDSGRISSLRQDGAQRDACGTGSGGLGGVLNQLVLYDDRPRAWDAWDIDAEYAEKACVVDGPAESWRVTATGPLRAAIEVCRPLGKRSRITQRYVVEAGSPRLDIQTRVEWHESRRLLRALFPVDVRSRRATYDIAFGHLDRAAHRNSPQEQAMFEVCAHRWMDLSEPGFGVALLNDGKYGHSCDGNVMGISLLRSPKFPDPDADMGVQEFTYSLMVHDGDWRAGGVDLQAQALNAPLIGSPLPPDRTGQVRQRWAPVTIGRSGAIGVAVAALKCAEDAGDGRRLICRLVETHGGRGQATVEWHLPVGAVEGVDLLERAMDVEGLSHDVTARCSTVPLGAFQIVTLAATLV